MQNIFIVGAKRTPFGAFGGSLKSLSATELATVATKSALSSGNVNPEIIDSVVVGNVISSSPEAPYLARHVGLKSGVPIASTALTINRLCGSGFESIIQGSMLIKGGDANVVVCGGTENMSAAPLVLDGNDARWGVSLGSGLKMRDTLWDGLTDLYAGTPMGITAENLATKYGITRQECDEFASRSQRLYGEAFANGVFSHEIAPVEVASKKGNRIIDADEHPRPETSPEKLSKLKAVFKKDGVVTAGNASGICDGAGSIILASEKAVHEHNLTPMARLVSYQVTGCEPTIMGIGPVDAIKSALVKANITLDQVDRVEINEAFAAQFLACAKELNLDMSKTNIHGGAISVGHPLGASGSRIVAHLANEFNRRDDSNIHVGAACIGGGQGIAVILERV